MKNALVAFVLITFFTSCKKEEIIIKEVEKQYRWQEYGYFNYGNVVQMNSFSTPDRLYVRGPYSLTTIYSDSLKQNLGESQDFYLTDYQSLMTKKLPICSDFSISSSEVSGSLEFLPTLNPNIMSTSTVFAVADLDSTFKSFDFINYTWGQCISINQKNQALIPYRDLNNNLKLLLVDVNFKFPDFGYVDTIKTKIISFTDNVPGIYGMNSCGDNFYLTANYDTYRITTVGEVTKLNQIFLPDIIQKNDTLYGIGTKKYVSVDDGITWAMGDELVHDFMNSSYTRIGDKIVGYRADQLFELILSSGGIQMRELDNDGLAGKSITSISEFDGKVYVTSFSGVYFKDFDDFFIGKE